MSDVERHENPTTFDDDEQAVAMGHATILGRAVDAEHTILATITAVVSVDPRGRKRCGISIATRGAIPELEILDLLAESVDECIRKGKR